MSVAEFIEFLNTALSAAVFPAGVDVEGEVAEYRVSQDKWIWFLLKDEQATVSCFATVWQLRQPLEDGLRVRIHGQPKVHAKSGKFSITVERAEPVGEGALRRAFELLKAKLAAAGLFAAERKRPLPRFPRRIGLIASAESAAYGDFLRILGARWGGLEIVLADVQVQGRAAAGQIASAFQWFDLHPDAADVLVLTRGGGSLEDLQPFNTEEVARAVAGSRIPVVCGVGHERDQTLADFAADVRASTPTNAAEIVVPDRRELSAAVEARSETLVSSLRSLVAARGALVADLASRLEASVRRGLAASRQRLSGFDAALNLFAAKLARSGEVLTSASQRLFDRMAMRLLASRSNIEGRERLLRGLDPKRLLGRGYAIVRARGRVLKDAALVDIGEELELQLSSGRLAAEVKERRPARVPNENL